MLRQQRYTAAQRGEKSAERAGNHYLRKQREGRADGNGKGMIRTEKKSSVLWLERQSEKKEGGRELEEDKSI